MVNEFLKYDGSEDTNNLVKIVNVIFEKGKYLAILGKP